MNQLDEVNRVYRGLRRRMNRSKPLDSFPFLSGDSYFYSCQFYFKFSELHKVPSAPGRTQKLKSIFLKVSEIDQFILFLSSRNQVSYKDYSLVLHNGDDTILPSELKQLEARFRKVYAVNLLSSGENSTPIPIGLENHNYFTNGIPGDFRKLLAFGLKSTQDRTFTLLQSFSLHTNRTEREVCSYVGNRLGCKLLEHASPNDYRKAVSDSKFVLSPAGNGYDCHRTWEAMYLGAIPIVRRIHWPFVDFRLPVLVIEEWDELLEIDLSSLPVIQDFTWSENFWNDFFHG